MTMGLLAAWSQSHLLDSISASFGSDLAVLTGIIMAGSTGMFIASTAFLPNTLSMLLLTFTWSHWLRGQDNRVLLLTALMAIIGWPYAVIAAIIPCLVSMKPSYSLSDGKRVQTISLSTRVKMELLVRRFILGALFSFVYILVPSLCVERYYYGRWTFPSLNAVIYNVLSSSGGPNIFGVEPWHYYILNLLLNFNIFIPTSLLAIICLSLDRNRQKLGLLYASMLLPIAMFTKQAHKEERFLFIVYPLVCFFAAYTLNWFQSLSRKLRPLVNAALILGLAISVMRTCGLIKFYAAPQTLLTNWEQADAGKLCMSSNWYRFPGSFYLRNSVRLGFLKDAVTHLQPAYFTDTKSELWNVNQLNKAVDEQYSDISECKWFMGTKDELPSQHSATLLMCEPIMRTTTKAPYRWLWIPFLSSGRVSWESMCIYDLQKPESESSNDVIPYR